MTEEARDIPEQIEKAFQKQALETLRRYAREAGKGELTKDGTDATSDSEHVAFVKRAGLATLILVIGLMVVVIVQMFRIAGLADRFRRESQQESAYRILGEFFTIAADLGMSNKTLGEYIQQTVYRVGDPPWEQVREWQSTDAIYAWIAKPGFADRDPEEARRRADLVIKEFPERSSRFYFIKSFFQDDPEKEIAELKPAIELNEREINNGGNPIPSIYNNHAWALFRCANEQPTLDTAKLMEAWDEVEMAVEYQQELIEKDKSDLFGRYEIFDTKAEIAMALMSTEPTAETKWRKEAVTALKAAGEASSTRTERAIYRARALVLEAKEKEPADTEKLTKALGEIEQAIAFQPSGIDEAGSGSVGRRRLLPKKAEIAELLMSTDAPPPADETSWKQVAVKAYRAAAEATSSSKKREEYTKKADDLERSSEESPSREG